MAEEQGPLTKKDREKLKKEQRLLQYRMIAGRPSPSDRERFAELKKQLED